MTHLKLRSSSLCAAFSTADVSFSEQSDNRRQFERKDGCLILPSHPDKVIRSVMAPMVAASDYPFRLFLRSRCGVDMTYTQMIHSSNFVRGKTFRRNHLDLFESGIMYPKLLHSQLACLEGILPIPDVENYQEEHRSPNMVQLAGNDVSEVLRAAEMILEHTDNRVSGFDLNLGCPQGIARKGNYGAFLMENDFNLVLEILSSLRKELPSSTAVSAKIRLPRDDATLQYRIPRLVETGINFMTVHGRTLWENKTKVGACHTERIRLAVEAAHKCDPNFPVVANGGIEDFNDVNNLLETTGAVAAMSSEALLETPNLFQRSSTSLTPRERLNQQLSFARDYLDICSSVVPPVPGLLGHDGAGSFCIIRGHLFKFLHRYLQEHHDLRDRLIDIETIVVANEMVDELEERYALKSEEELLACPSSSATASWYRRYRNPDRRVHQKDVNISSIFSPNQSKEVSVEERKKIIRERIARLKNNKANRNQKAML